MSYASSCSATPPKSRVPTLGGGGWLTGHLLPLRRDPLGLFTRAVRELGDTVRIPLGGRELILLRHPDHVKHVLLDHSGNFNKQTRGFDALRILLGRGLLTSEGAFWLRQRRIAQPGFHRARISHFADQMVRCTEVALRGWEVKVGGEGELDVAAEMMALTLRIVGQTLLSTDVSGDTRLVGEAMPVLMTTMVRRVTSFFEWPAGIPTRENRAFARATRAMDRLIYRIIEERRRGEGQTDDLLDMLLNARDESSGERMSDVQVRDEVMTLFLAGHETTANTLTWVFHLLADHPEVAARARVEATAVLGTDRGERLPTF
ncbi:MAG: cytochrome P450, partial [Myxococcaceae bacterium]